eukprot:5601591-Pyramimonas_sp.AAC.1
MDVTRSEYIRVQPTNTNTNLWRVWSVEFRVGDLGLLANERINSRNSANSQGSYVQHDAAPGDVCN